MIYLDNSATTRQYDEVTEMMYRAAKDNFGNPSSLHTLGFEAGNLLYDARRQVEKLLPPAGNVIFTSGGTEADNMALYSSARKLRRRGNKIITTKVEHPAVLETCKRLAEDGFEVVYLDVDVDGYVEEQAVKAALDDNTIIVSIMTVNNEVGTIEPVSAVSRTVREYNRVHGTEIIFHTDAVQAFGKLSLDGLDADIICASGHKFHGPKGTGIMYVKKRHKLPAFITGGGQEGGLRSSTENTPGIAGIGLAAEMSAADQMMKISRMGMVNNYLLSGLRSEISDIIVNGPEELGYSLEDHGRRCPTVLNVTFEGTRGEVLLHTLEQDGIYVSTGSACSSHKTGDSHVLSAMSMTHKEIEGAIRFSFSEFNTVEEMDEVIARTKTAVERFRRLGSFR
ncbi:MAG: cysteine desulfurase [Clostridiales bacterium]|nr:cysteine desulfurase [Clostridiales bacterium]